jgi:hypothetical protein
MALHASTMACTLAAFFPHTWIKPSSPQLNIHGRMLARSRPMMLV